MKLRRLRLTKKAASVVLEGHPWVFPDGLVDPPKLKAGEEVELLDAISAVVARGIADGPRDGWGPAVRVLTRDPRDPPLRKLLFRRIGAAARLRERVVPVGTDGYRLLHGEGDGLPGLVVDRYGKVLVVRPDSAAWRPHRAAVIEALRSEGPPGVTAIFERSKAGESEVIWSKGRRQPPESVVINEAGRKYWVRPGFGQKTGFFLDQRPNRTMAQALTRPGDRCLNLFSFTGGFSVAMGLAGGRVVSVDRAASILADCREQFELNGLDPAAHAFEAADAFSWLPKFAASRPEPFDIVVCDPPALAHKREDLPQARQAYRRLHQALGPVLKPGGLLMTCSCTSRLGEEELLEDARGGLMAAERSVDAVVARGGAGGDHPVPPDFPEGRYLSVLVLRVA